MNADPPTSGMALAEVLRVLDAVEAVGCRYWLQGGWGVDALLGRPSRAHRDVDVDFDADREREVLAALARLGYVVETDWRPNRVELVAAGRGWVDLHPLTLRDDGSALQPALDGGHYELPATYFTTGSLGGRPIPCITAAAQRRFRSGYPPRPEDLHDLRVLQGLAGHPPVG